MDNNNLGRALEELKKGNFVLVHDSDGRENETDLVIAAEFIGARDVVRMRRDGGGLICLAVGGEISEKIGLPFMSDILNLGSVEFPALERLKADDIRYDERSSFSVTINHRRTFTGITDADRALTISEFGRFCGGVVRGGDSDIGAGFRSPGHVHLLISSGLENRQGHTELSTALMEMAGITQAAAICEMMDGESHGAVSREGAMSYAKREGFVFLESGEVEKGYGEFVE